LINQFGNYNIKITKQMEKKKCKRCSHVGILVGDLCYGCYQLKQDEEKEYLEKLKRQEDYSNYHGKY